MNILNPATWFARRRPAGAVSVRSFAAADVSRILGPWTFDGGFSNDEVCAALATMRARSRDMYKNSAHHRRYINLVANNLVGTGFKFKSLPTDGYPGEKNARPDRMAAQRIQYHWWRWCSTPAYCDSTGRKTVAQIDRLCAKNLARDGEYFIIVDRFEPTERNPYGVSLRVIRPDACDERFRGTLENGNIVRGGVELDARTLAPVAYYLFTRREYSTTTGERGPLVRVPAASVIHGYTQEDEDQTRGVPMGHSVLKKLKMIDEYDQAELVAARDEACSVSTYEAPLGRDDEIVDLTDPQDAEAVAACAALTMPKEPGQAEVLPQGWRRTVSTPQHPNREVTAYKNGLLRDVATGYLIEYACFANDWAGVSYSSVRQGTIAERDMWMVLQDDFIAQCKTPVFLRWLDAFLLSDVSGGLPYEKRQKFADHVFRGRRWTWVDPLKDIRAAEIAVQHGWKTDSQIAEDYDADFDDNLEEVRRTDALKKGTSLEVKPNEKTSATA